MRLTFKKEDYPSWWNFSWRGKVVIVVASGRDAKGIKIFKDENTVVATINTSYQLFPDADIAYGCDARWWKLHRGLPGFKGVKISQDPQAAIWGVHLVRADRSKDVFLYDKPGEIGWGGNGGFQMLNLALQMQPKKVIMVGFNLGGDRWHGEHPGFPIAKLKDVERHRRVIDAAASTFKKFGIPVLNTSKNTTLKNYPVVTMEEAMAHGD